MARNRIIKPSFFADEKLSSVSDAARVLFMGLIVFSDDMGRQQFNARRTRLEIFPADLTKSDKIVETLVSDLATAGVIELYTVGKTRYLYVPNFLKHQFIKKPSHTDNPPSPSEGAKPILCRCLACELKRKTARGNGNVPAGTTPPEEYQYSTSGEPEEEQARTSSLRNWNRNWNRKEPLHGKSREDIHIGEIENQREGANPEPSQKERRAQSLALQEIAINMIALLNVDSNPNILQTLLVSIQKRARSASKSIEAAAQEIAARAAYLAAQAPPESWEQWFFDARYEYVPEGDRRLLDTKVEARPVCGGSRCTEGWETVQVGGQSVSRRCPDCAQRWKDAGLA